MATKLKNALGIIVGIVLITASANAQMVNGRPSTMSTGFVFTHWTLESDGEETSLGQWWVPLSGFVAIQEDLEARYYIAGSSNNFEVNKVESNLDGIGDVRLEMTRSFSNNQFFISGGMNLPSGKTKLAFNKDQAIIETLSQSFLIYPMRRFGEGFGLNGTIGVAQTWENSVIGLGVSYDFIGKYTPYEGSGKYDPGDIVTVQSGFSTRGSKTAFALGLDFMHYVVDKIDGRKAFEQGDQVVVSTSLVFDNTKFRLNPSVRYTARGRNTRFQANTELIRDRLKLYGNEIEIGLDMGKYIRSGWYIGPLFSLLLIDDNEDAFGNSKILTTGATISKVFSQNLSFGTWFKVYNGDTDGGRIDLLGYQVSASLMAVL